MDIYGDYAAGIIQRQLTAELRETARRERLAASVRPRRRAVRRAHSRWFRASGPRPA